MPVADELVTILGVDMARDALGKLDAFKSGVAKAQGALFALSAAAAASLTAAGLMVKGAAEEAAALDKVADKTGLSREALQEWGFAAEAAGGAASSVHNDLSSLAEKFRGTGKDAEKTLLSLAQRLKGMNAGKAFAHGAAFGLSEDTVRLLRQGKEGIAALRAEARQMGGVIPEEAVKRAALFQKSLARWSYAWKGISAQAALSLVPALERVLGLLGSWTAENRALVSQGLAAFMEGLVAGFARFGRMLSSLGSFIAPALAQLEKFGGGMGAMELVAHLVTGALTGLLVIFSPLLAKLALIAAAVMAAAVVLEDLFSSISTGKGLFADLFRAFEERWPALASALRFLASLLREGVASALSFAGEAARSALEVLLAGASSLLDALNALLSPAKDFFGAFSGNIPALAALLKDTLAGAVSFAADKLRGLTDFFFAALDKISGALGRLARFMPSFSRGLLPPGRPERMPERERDIRAVNYSVRDTARGLADAAKLMGGAHPGGAAASPLPASVPAAAYRRGGTTQTYTDMRTVNQQIATSDPQQAADAMLRGLNEQAPDFPGSFSPSF